MKKVMVIGMDGCTFTVLDRLIDEGKLPNLASLMKEGVSGSLESTVPPTSAPAWTTFQTGKGPGKHGIFDFFRNVPETYGHTPVNSSFIETDTFWEILSRRGRSIGIINLVFSYPPKPVNGFIVTGKQTPSEDVEYTYPADLKREILDFEPGYEVEPFKRVSQSEQFLRRVPECLLTQERVNSYLISKHPTDFVFNLFAVPDVIQHPFWRHIDPTHPLYTDREGRRYRPLFDDCFKTLDDIVGERVANHLDEDTALLIMSDHGAGGVHRILEANRWLRTHGLLAMLGGLNGRAPFRRRVKGTLMAMLSGLANKVGLRSLLRMAGLKKGGSRGNVVRRATIDWSRTKAYAGRIGEDGIYCNLKGREKHGIVEPGVEYEELRDLIVSELSRITDPVTGSKVFKRVCKREEIYEGPYVSLAPDIILDYGDYPYLIGDALSEGELFHDAVKNRVTGKHREHGILIAYGKGIRKGSKLDGARICDLAPTILHLMGEAVPEDMDGQVLDVFEDGMPAPRYVRDEENKKAKPGSEKVLYSPEASEEIENRLKDLGYL